MSYDLHARQFASVRHNSRVSFIQRTLSNTFCAFHLKPYQFENLNDIIQHLELYRLKAYPLGANVWIYKDNKDVQLVNHNTDRYFLFYPSSWHTYKRHVHRRLLTLLRYGTHKNRQRHASCGSLSHSISKSFIDNSEENYIAVDPK